MAFEYFTQNPMIAIIFTFIGVLVIGYAKWYERKTSPGSTETWDDKKFGLFFVVAAGVMIFEYYATGTIAFPGEDTINSFIQLLNPIFAIFGTAYTVLIAGKLAKNNVVVPVVAGIQAGAAAKNAETIETNWLALSVTPTYKFGVSPFEVAFNLYGTQPTPDHAGINSVDIDWGDGQKQLVPMVKGGAEVKHTFTFVKNDKYTGHTFYPVFVANGNDGSSKTYNIEGKMVEIWVQSA
jgi:hypothetical protein